MKKENDSEQTISGLEQKNDEVIEEMIEAGVHLGHKISKLHPKMGDYIVGIKNTVHIINLEETKVLLEKALEFIAEISKAGKKIIIVGTKPPLKKLVEETAKECGMPYVSERWLGGTFTNFRVIYKKAKSFRELEKDKEEGKFEKLTKKENIKIDKNLVKLRRKFEGIKNLEEMPEAIFICDLMKDKSAFKEARMKKIKTIAIVDTNVDPTLVDYPIPANDDAICAVKYILDRIKETILKNKIKNV